MRGVAMNGQEQELISVEQDWDASMRPPQKAAQV